MERTEITLASLRSYIRAKGTENEHGEIRQFMIANLDEIAALFGRSRETLAEAMGNASDSELVPLTLASIDQKLKADRSSRAEERWRAACEAIGAVAAAGKWDGDRFYIDAAALFRGLGAPTDRLMIGDDAGTWTHAIPVRKLAQTAALKKQGMVAWVDFAGIHFRWNDGRGGLSFTSQGDGEGALIPMALPPRAPVATPALEVYELPAAAAAIAEILPPPAPVPAPEAPKPRRARRPARPYQPSDWQPFVSAKAELRA